MRRESIIGQIVADRFKVLSLLGEGGTGQVYLAEHNVLERQFAIKVLRRDLISDQTAAERFRREARAASRMQHRNIVYISDFGTLKDGRLYLVMEYIPGDELAAAIAREKRLPPERAARILLQVADALDYAHEKGVVHRDLKAENIILTTERHRQDVVKILDFGLAKILYGAGNLDTITFKGQIFGTPEYIPPEQIVGDEVDQRADIYAMGVLAFELVTGRTPFTGTLMELLVAHRKLAPPAPSAICPEAGIPACFDEIVARAMQKRPADRFQRASDLASVLRGYLVDRRKAARVVLDSDLELPEPGPSADAMPAAMAPREPTPQTEPAPIQASRAAPAPAPSGPALRVPASSYTTTLVDGAPSATQTDPGRREARRQLREQLRRVGDLLRRAGLGDRELVEVLAESARQEEAVLEVETELALLETKLEDIELSGREQESQLRYAIIDLGMERGRLEQATPPAPTREAMLQDLQFQIAELERRLLDVARTREAELDALDSRIAEQRRSLDDLRAALVRQDRSLLERLLAHQPQAAAHPALRAAFEELEALCRLLPP